MGDIARILVAIKCTPVGRHTFLRALALARQLDAWLHVFHALDYHLLQSLSPDEDIEAATLDVQRRFDQELRPLLADYPRFSFNVWETEPATGVCELAGATNADLVIIGCHKSPSGASVSRVGLVASSILETAPCPVMLIPCDQRAEREMESFNFRSPQGAV